MEDQICINDYTNKWNLWAMAYHYANKGSAKSSEWEVVNFVKHVTMTPANAATPGMNPNEKRVTVKQGYAGLHDAGVAPAL